MSKATTKKKKPFPNPLLEIQSVPTDSTILSFCVLKFIVRSLVLLPYLLGLFRVKCCLEGAPNPSAYSAEMFFCSWFSCFPNTVSNNSGFHFQTFPFLLQLCFATANENNQQTPFVACISYLPLSYSSFCSCWVSMFSSVRKWQALAKSTLS